MPLLAQLHVYDNNEQVDGGRAVPDPALVMEMRNGRLAWPAPDEFQWTRHMASSTTSFRRCFPGHEACSSRSRPRGRGDGVAGRALDRVCVQRVGAATGLRPHVPRSVYFLDNPQQGSDRGVASVTVLAWDTFSVSKPERLFDLPASVRGVALVRNFGGEFEVSPDGQRFLFMKDGAASAPAALHVVLNWSTELGRIAGAR